MNVDEGGGLGWLLQPQVQPEIALIRTCVTECNIIDITHDTTVADILTCYFPDQGPKATINLLQRDALGRVISITPLNPTDLVAPFAQIRLYNNGNTECHPSKDQSVMTPNVNEEDHHQYQRSQCNLWLAEETIRIFFNPYIRMILGLPMWYLDLPVDQFTTVRDLKLLLSEYLNLTPGDDRFAIHGNYQTHIALMDAETLVLPLIQQHDPQGTHFWQFMMRADREEPSHLGVSRQTILWLQKRTYWLGSRMYWFVLQGTTLYYYKQSPWLAAANANRNDGNRNKKGRKAIENIDQCQIIYRGGSRRSKTYAFDLITLDGRRYRLKSPNKRRIEKWMRCLRAAHHSCEINEPMTMSLIKKMTAPQDHPPLFPIPSSSFVKPQKSQSDLDIAILNHNRKFIPESSTLKDEKDRGRLLEELESLLTRIDYQAQELCSRPKGRRREVRQFVEHIRRLLILVVKLDGSTSFFCNVIPEIKLLIDTLQNFLDVVEGRSEFVITASRTTDYVEEAMESVIKLATFYRDYLKSSPSQEERNAEIEVMDGEEYEEHQRTILKLRKSLKQPIPQIKLNGLRVRRGSSVSSSFKAKLKKHDMKDSSLGSQENKSLNRSEEQLKSVDSRQPSKSLKWFNWLTKSSHAASPLDEPISQQSKRQARISEQEAQQLSVASPSSSVAEDLGTDTHDRQPRKSEQFWRQKQQFNHDHKTRIANNQKHRTHARSKGGSLLSWLGLIQSPLKKDNDTSLQASPSRSRQKAQSEDISVDGSSGLVADDELEEDYQRHEVNPTFNSPRRLGRELEPFQELAETNSCDYKRSSGLLKIEQSQQNYRREPLGPTNRRHSHSQSFSTRPEATRVFVPDKDYPPPPPPPSTCNTPLVRGTLKTNFSTDDPRSHKIEDCDSVMAIQTGASAIPTVPTPLRRQVHINSHHSIPAKTTSFGRHCRSQSMRSNSNILARPTGDDEEDCDSSSSTLSSSTRRKKSIVEIDQTLLQVLLKDPRLAPLVHSSNIRSKGQEGQTNQDEPTTYTLDSPIRRPHSVGNVSHRQSAQLTHCDLCNGPILEQPSGEDDLSPTSKDVVTTPFASFHRQCLRCADCGCPLSTQSFRREGNRAKCRNPCDVDKQQYIVS